MPSLSSAPFKNGLVDKLGNINDAIASAAKKAKVKDYSVVAYPEQESGLKALTHGMSSEVRVSMIKSELGDNFKYYNQIKEASRLSGIQMRLPYEVTVK